MPNWNKRLETDIFLNFCVPQVLSEVEEFSLIVRADSPGVGRQFRRRGEKKYIVKGGKK